MGDTKKGIRNQYYTALCANLIAVGYGMSLGWSSPYLPVLQSIESPLPFGKLSIDESLWVVACFSVGGLIGTILFGFLLNCWGRKSCIYLAAFLQIINWILTAVPINVYLLYIARILAGAGGAGIFVIAPIYVSETSSDKIRGTLGIFTTLGSNAGLLLGYIIFGYLNYYLATAIAMIIPIIFCIGFYVVPETPEYLLSKHDYKNASVSICFFRGISKGSKDIIQDFINKNTTNSKNEKTKIKCEDFSKIEVQKGLVITIITLSLTQLCGIFILSNHVSSIFLKAGSSLSPNMSSITVAIVQLIGSAISTILIDNIGRKFLLWISALFTGLALTVLACYSYVQVNGIDVSAAQWLPISCLAIAMFCASWGILTIPYIFSAELLPSKIRGAVMSSVLSVLWFTAIFWVKYFYEIEANIGLHGLLFVFGGCCFFEFFFIIFLVPETKGKSFDEIQNRLRFR